MKKNKSVIAIVSIVALGCLIMGITDAIIKPTYVIKSIVKIIFFLVIPMIYFWKTKEIDIKKIIVPNKRGFIIALLLGIAVYVLIIGAYMILKDIYDFSKITGLLTSNVGVNSGNFVFVAIYISFFNSLLEEFFFRGIAFLGMLTYSGKKSSYMFSSIMFALYHVAIMIGWFSIGLFLLVMVGLIIGGVLFNYLNEKSGNVYSSWAVHMFANFAINTIGFILFGIIG